MRADARGRHDAHACVGPRVQALLVHVTSKGPHLVFQFFDALLMLRAAEQVNAAQRAAVGAGPAREPRNGGERRLAAETERKEERGRKRPARPGRYGCDMWPRQPRELQPLSGQVPRQTAERALARTSVGTRRRGGKRAFLAAMAEQKEKKCSNEQIC